MSSQHRFQATTSQTSTTLLTYALTSAPAPLQVSPATGAPSTSTLSIVASAPVGSSVTVSRVTLVLPIGDPTDPDSTDLTEQSPDVPRAVDSTGTAWDVILGTDSGTYLITPPNGSQTLSSDGLTITVTGIVVSPIVGTATVVLLELANDGSGPNQTGTQTFGVPKFPYGFFAGNFVASAPIVTNGQTVTLTWNGSSQATYTLMAGSNPAVNVSNVNSYVSPPLTQTTVFILSVTAQTAGQSVTLYFTLTVVVSDPNLIANALTVNGPTILNGPTTLSGQTSMTGPVSSANYGTQPFPLRAGVWQANTDGYVVGTAGPPAGQTVACLSSGAAVGVCYSSGSQPVFFCATGGTGATQNQDGRDAWQPLYGTFTMPVSSAGAPFILQDYNDLNNDFPISTSYFFIPSGFMPVGQGVVVQEVGDGPVTAWSLAPQVIFASSQESLA
ncbi:MAG TPA: hypothetical protein VI653_27435 [Steroidobacteraceae bacterium]